MYNEKNYKKHIFWIQAKRIFLLLLFTALGTTLGVIISSYIVDVLLFNFNLKPIIISFCGIAFLLITLLLTSKTGKEVQDAYWRIAVINELQSISKKLDSLDNLEKLEALEKLNNLEIKRIKKIKTKISETNEINTINDDSITSKEENNDNSADETESESPDTNETIDENK